MKRIELTQGKYALVDDKDYEYLNNFNWSFHNAGKGYAYRQSPIKNGKRYCILMHRFITKCSSQKEVDHIDNNGLNNQRKNLRVVTASQNRMNTTKRLGCYSKYKGVTWMKNRSKWKTQICVKGKSIHIGVFLSEKKAAYAYNAAAKLHFGKYAKLNKIR